MTELAIIAVIITALVGLIGFWRYKKGKNEGNKAGKSEEKSAPSPSPKTSQKTASPPKSTRKTEPHVPWNVPFPRNSNFIGREAEMEELKEILDRWSRAVISQAGHISWMGGVGKTQLAVEYAHQYKSEYPGGILWLRGSEDVTYKYGRLSETLDLRLPREMEENEKCRRVQRCLQQKHEKTLLALDNLDDKGVYESIRSYLPTTGDSHILITTCRKDMGGDSKLSLDIFPDEKALKLLITGSGRDSENMAAAQNICRILGNLPLALEAAGKYLNKITDITLEQYCIKLTETGLFHRCLQDDKILLNTDHTSSLKAVLITNRELVNNPLVLNLISAAMCFEPDNINPEILAMVCGLSWERDKELVWKHISTLHDYSLVQIQDDNRLSIHRLMRDALREWISLPQLKKMQYKYVIHLQKWFDEHNEETSLKTISPELPHILGAARLALEDGLWPQSYDFCIDLGRYNGFIGRYRQALEWDQKSKAEVEVHAPEDQAKLALSYNNIGESWIDLGEYQKSIDYYKQALSSTLKIYGDKHPNVASILNNLGLAWKLIGEHAKAVSYYEQALSIDQGYYGKHHPKVAVRLDNLGGVWKAQGKDKKALGYYEQALSIDQQHYGASHPTVAIRLNNLGEIWDNLKKPKKAISCYEQVLYINKQYYGEQHPAIARDLKHLGGAWDTLGDHAKAIGYYEQALTIDRQYYGERHADVVIDLNNLGIAWKARAEYDKARRYYLEAYNLCREFLPEDHPYNISLMRKLKALKKNEL